MCYKLMSEAGAYNTLGIQALLADTGRKTCMTLKAKEFAHGY